jgi:hypothetical protein
MIGHVSGTRSGARNHSGFRAAGPIHLGATTSGRGLTRGARVRVVAPWSTLRGLVGVIVGEVDGEWLVQLDGERRPLRFGPGALTLVDSRAEIDLSRVFTRATCPPRIPDADATTVNVARAGRRHPCA